MPILGWWGSNLPMTTEFPIFLQSGTSLSNVLQQMFLKTGVPLPTHSVHLKNGQDMSWEPEPISPSDQLQPPPIWVIRPHRPCSCRASLLSWAKNRHFYLWWWCSLLMAMVKLRGISAQNSIYGGDISIYTYIYIYMYVCICIYINVYTYVCI